MSSSSYNSNYSSSFVSTGSHTEGCTCDSAATCTCSMSLSSMSSISPLTPARKKHHHDRRENCPRNDYPRYDPGTSMFNSVITPVTNLNAEYSQNPGSVEFRMRRKNKVVSIQWEPFSGNVAASGIAFLTVAQSISNTPPYPVQIAIPIQYKGADRTTKVVIDPFAKNGNIKFYLNNDGTANGIAMGDSFVIYGGTAEWQVD